MFKIKVVSGLEKVFADKNFEDYREFGRISALRGERVSFQLICHNDRSGGLIWPRKFSVKTEGALAEHLTIRRVRSIPATNNARGNYDADYITTRPALIPDALMPLEYGGMAVIQPDALVAFWCDLEIPRDASAGVGKISFEFTSEAAQNSEDPDIALSAAIELEVIGATLPKQELKFTQWFHSDCLANYYHCEKWSDEHFRIIKNFAKVAKKNGINMLLTPLVSPPLDNSYDTRDLQLAIVTKKGDGYEFDWSILEKWLAAMDECDVEYYEIGHLFTQGGAEFATKVMGYVNGEYVRLFSKDTPSTGPEYVRFLRALLTSFLAFMKERNRDGRCFFHISDEPPLRHLETYRKAKESVADLLEGYTVMDALSHYDFYETGILKTPVVLMSYLQDFADHGVKGLWTYNCCCPENGYSNRFLAMTLARNRSICLMLYKYDVAGFLHWGYNFYNNSGSADFINPYVDASSGDIFPSGDPFSVYPGDGGDCIESMRLVTFNEAIQDLRAFRLCESLYSREEVIAALEAAIGSEIRPSTYLNSGDSMLALRETINEMIKRRV